MFGPALQVFKRPAYAALALATAALVFTLAVWVPNWRLLLALFQTDAATGAEKLSVLVSLYGSIATNFTIISASYTIAIALLFGINIALLAYYIRGVRAAAPRGSGVQTAGAAGVGGLVSGTFGIGCAACGTFLLSAALGLIGAAGIVAALPLGGEEFGILGVGLLSYSVYATAKRVGTAPVCLPDSTAGTSRKSLGGR